MNEIIFASNILVEESNKPVLIDDLNLSVRTYNCLKRAGINTVDDVMALSLDEVMKIRNLGKNSILELQKTVNSYFNYPFIKWVAFVSYYWFNSRLKIL